MRAGLLAAAVLALASPARAAPASGTTAAMACSGHGSHGVTIQSCSFTLEPSPAGNPNYFVTVTLRYSAPNPAMAVRFRCALGDGNSAVSQYGVLRQSGGHLTFVSPFAKSVVRSIDCFVDAT